MDRPEPQGVEPMPVTGALPGGDSRFAAAFFNAGVMLLILRAADGTIVEVNREFLAETGYRREEIVGATAQASGLFADPLIGQRIAAGIRESGRARDVEAQVMNRAGDVIHALVSSDPIMIDGAPHLVATVLNTTKRHEAEEALRTSEARYRSLVEQTADGVLLLDSEGRIIDSNPAMADLLGRPIETIRGTPWPDYVEPSNLAELPFLQPALGSGGPAVFERRVVRPDRSVVEVEIHARQFAQGSMLGTVRDVGARKAAERERAELEDQLRQAQKMEAVGRLAGGVAHDFNNLLTAISGFTELAAAEAEPGSEVAEYLEEIRRSAERATALTRQLLAFGRRAVLQPRVLDLNLVVTEIAPMLRRIIGDDVRLEVVPGQGLRRTRADRGQLEQVIVNLAANARDAMPGGGKLTIATENVADGGSQQWVRMRISDTGVGMDDATAEHIFEPFFTTKGPGSGTGLGLATVFGIVRQSGGNVAVISTPGQGSTFCIDLPVNESDPEEMAGPASDRPTERGRGTLLVVEDEPAVLSFAAHLLERSGYTVLCAASGEEAVELAKNYSGPIDLIFSDMVMPGLTGHETAGAVRATRPDIRLLFASGYSEETNVTRVAGDSAAEDAAFVAKPYGMEALLRAVRDVLAAD
jgi:two-component system cell cycle sensor histidine kinase/response regulator CckA